MLRVFLIIFRINLMEDDKKNIIGKDYSLFGLAKYALPAIAARFFRSLLSTIDDTLFISRYCGEYALASFSLVIPLTLFVESVNTMLGAAATKCSMMMGEKKGDKAHGVFTSIIFVELLFGVVVYLLISNYSEEVLRLLGATDILMPYGKEYLSIFRLFMPISCINGIFDRFYSVAGKTKTSMFSTVVNVFCNFFFDWLLIVNMDLGVSGAGYANLIANIAQFIIGVLVYSNRKSDIHFSKPILKFWDYLKQICRLGLTDAVSFVSYAISGLLANRVLIEYGSENYMAAYSITDTLYMLFTVAFFGLTASTCPLVSYAFGEKNKEKLVGLFKKISLLMTILAIVSTSTSMILKDFVLGIYLNNYEVQEIIDLAHFGMKIVPLSNIFYGYNLLVQEIAIAVGNTKVSMTLTILENFVFINITTFLLPVMFGAKATFFNFLSAELITFFFTLYAVIKNKDLYGYGRSGVATLIEDK